MKCFSILRPMKNYVRFEYVPWKICDFVSLPLFVFSLVIKLKNIDFESLWNTLILFDKKIYVLWKKISDLVSLSLFGFTLVIKLKKLDFKSHWNISIFFNEKYMTSYLNMSQEKISDFVSFPLLDSILNFIEIV